MTVSEIIQQLQSLQTLHGDLAVIMDDYWRYEKDIIKIKMEERSNDIKIIKMY